MVNKKYVNTTTACYCIFSIAKGGNVVTMDVSLSVFIHHEDHYDQDQTTADSLTTQTPDDKSDKGK